MSGITYAHFADEESGAEAEEICPESQAKICACADWLRHHDSQPLSSTAMLKTCLRVHENKLCIFHQMTKVYVWIN